MDFSLIIRPVITMLWYLLPIAILTGIIKSPWFKGVIGEFIVNVIFKFSLPKDQYHLIKNVTLPTDDGTTQIDHIIVSKFGIFVVETKNMKGWIFGNATQKQWTQKIYKFSTKFQNPIHQNYKHLKTLQSCLGINSDSIFSVIVFIGESVFKTDMPENVTYARGSIRFIKSKKTIFFDDNQVEELIKLIEGDRLSRGMRTNRQHVSYVKGIIKSKIDEQVCPKCGAGMKLRETKKGANIGNKFWGFSTFPKCRGVVNLTNSAL